LPRDGVRREQRTYTDEEVRRMIQAAPEPFKTILAITAVLGLRIGETLGLRWCDVDFKTRIIRIRQSIDSASRTIVGVKSKASSADMPMSAELEVFLHAHQLRHDGKSELLFVNRDGRPLCADKLREKKLHPLQAKLGIPRGGFHGMRHGASAALFDDGASPALVQRQLRHSDPRITLAIYGHVVGDKQRTAVQNRSTRIVN
jgi:integrase